MSQPNLTPKTNVNLRRIELTLLSRLIQLKANLDRLTEAQEQLIHTIDYLHQSSSPFLVLSYIRSPERYLDSQHTEIAATKDAILELIRILQELRL
jgi:hypothetical protein